MITDWYDVATEPLLSLRDFYGEKKHILDKCLIILSRIIHEHILESFDCVQVAELTACNGSTPIYKFKSGGEDVARGDVLAESDYETADLYKANHDLFKLHLTLKMLERI